MAIDQDPVAALEKRQESILDRLKALQIRVDSIQASTSGVRSPYHFVTLTYSVLTGTVL